MITYLYQLHELAGYGDLQQTACVVDGLDHALVYNWNGDNEGPSKASQYAADWKEIKKLYPNARIFASTFDNFTAHLRAWNQTRSALKQDAAAAGRPEPAVYGNVHIVENVYSVLVSQYLDVVWTETPAFLPRVGKPTWGSPATGFSALQYKLGRAAGNFSKPHWGIVTLTGCGLAPAGAASAGVSTRAGDLTPELTEKKAGKSSVPARW